MLLLWRRAVDKGSKSPSRLLFLQYHVLIQPFQVKCFLVVYKEYFKICFHTRVKKRKCISIVKFITVNVFQSKFRYNIQWICGMKMYHIKPTIMLTLMFILNVTAVTTLSTLVWVFLINTNRTTFLRIQWKLSSLFTFIISIAENHYFPNNYSRSKH